MIEHQVGDIIWRISSSCEQTLYRITLLNTNGTSRTHMATSLRTGWDNSILYIDDDFINISRYYRYLGSHIDDGYRFLLRIYEFFHYYQKTRYSQQINKSLFELIKHQLPTEEERLNQLMNNLPVVYFKNKDLLVQYFEQKVIRSIITL